MFLKGLDGGNMDGEGLPVSTFEKFAPLDTCYQGAEEETWPVVMESTGSGGPDSQSLLYTLHREELHRYTFSKEVQVLTPLSKTQGTQLSSASSRSTLPCPDKSGIPFS